MILSGRKAAIMVGALIISVGVNIFAAAAWGTHEFQRNRGRSSSYGIERLVRTAPEEVRGLVEADFDAMRPELKSRMAGVREARAEVARLMRDPGADERAMTSAFAELRLRYGEVAILVHETLVATATKMDPSLRAEWASQWEKRQ